MFICFKSRPVQSSLSGWLLLPKYTFLSLQTLFVLLVLLFFQSVLASKHPTQFSARTMLIGPTPKISPPPRIRLNNQKHPSDITQTTVKALYFAGIIFCGFSHER